MKKRDFIISTTNHLEGYSIEKYIGIVSDRIVVGAGMLSEFFASFTDVFGDRSIAFENRIEELHELAITNIEKKAKAMGANSLIGITMDTDEISGKNMMMFMATVTGTAVIVRKKEVNIEQYVKEEYFDVITAKEVENIILIKQYKDKLSEEKLSLNDLSQTTRELINRNIIIPIELFLDAITKIKYQDFLDDVTIDIIIDYLSMYNKSELNEELNKRIKDSSISESLFNVIYAQAVKIDYKDILNIIDEIDLRILDKTIFKNLLKYKDTYEYKDIEYIEMLINKLRQFKHRDMTEKYKGTLLGGWVCLCGTKNADSLKNCKSCNKGKNGFTFEQSAQIDKIIKQLDNVKLALIANYSNTKTDLT